MNPIEVSDPDTSLEAAFVQRYAIESLTPPWQQSGLNGIYVLLSEQYFANSFKAYVGATADGFEQALQERNEKSAFWSNAILFANHDGTNLTVAQAEQLAGEVVQFLQTGNHIKLENETDDFTVTTMNAGDTFVNEMALFVIRMMFLQGYRSASLARAIHPIEVDADTTHGPYD